MIFFTHKDEIEEDKDKKEDITTVLPVIILFTLYVFTLEILGFDVGTVVFIALFLFFHGEN